MKINEEIYNSVEQTLSKFPTSWQKNYYQNKNNLKIISKKGEIRSISANYEHEKNIITIYNQNMKSLPHELFHMAFRDKDKIEKELTNGIIYSNGVSFKNITEEIIYLKSITEGFAEYLSRFSTPYKGHNIEYFFINLLISIYGEEILEYPLKNDPLGFLKYDQFTDIFTFSKNLDCYNTSIEEIQIILYMKDELTKKIKEDKNTGIEIISLMEHNIETFNKSIINTFNSITNEYLSCKNPKIENSLFIKKLTSFLTDNDYAICFSLHEDKFNVRKELIKSIEYVKKKR